MVQGRWWSLSSGPLCLVARFAMKQIKKDILLWEVSLYSKTICLYFYFEDIRLKLRSRINFCSDKVTTLRYSLKKMEAKILN